ncbi:RNA polymerase II transcription regulator recruiting protein [Aureococcus anophagefferens]|nr:RNA polymerase II transcription regulator recruiting protein [Aureococcus anophagefferens]
MADEAFAYGGDDFGSSARRRAPFAPVQEAPTRGVRGYQENTELWLKAAHHGNVEALVRLGLAPPVDEYTPENSEEVNGVTKLKVDLAKGRAALLELATHGDCRSYYVLGLCRRDGLLGFDVDFAAAVAAWRTAADARHLVCMLLAAKALEHGGDGVSADRRARHGQRLPAIAAAPMDFGTVKAKLDAGDYTVHTFAADVRLVFRNAMTFNVEGDDVHEAALWLDVKFEKRYADALAGVFDALPPAAAAALAEAKEKARTSSRWTEREHQRVVELYVQYPNDWSKVAKGLPGRTEVAVERHWSSATMKRYLDALPPAEAAALAEAKEKACTSSPWTPHEHQLLRELYVQYPNDWSEIAKGLPGRSEIAYRNDWSEVAKGLPGRNETAVEHHWYSAAMKRYLGTLPPAEAAALEEAKEKACTSSPWTPHEHQRLFELYVQYPNNWSEVAKGLPGRTEEAVKQHWNDSPAMKRYLAGLSQADAKALAKAKEKAFVEKLLKRADAAAANAVADDAKHANRERRLEEARRHALEQAVLCEEARRHALEQAVLCELRGFKHEVEAGMLAGESLTVIDVRYIAAELWCISANEAGVHEPTPLWAMPADAKAKADAAAEAADAAAKAAGKPVASLAKKDDDGDHTASSVFPTAKAPDHLHMIRGFSALSNGDGIFVATSSTSRARRPETYSYPGFFNAGINQNFTDVASQVPNKVNWSKRLEDAVHGNQGRTEVTGAALDDLIHNAKGLTSSHEPQPGSVVPSNRWRADRVLFVAKVVPGESSLAPHRDVKVLSYGANGNKLFYPIFVVTVAFYYYLRDDGFFVPATDVDVEHNTSVKFRTVPHDASKAFNLQLANGGFWANDVRAGGVYTHAAGCTSACRARTAPPGCPTRRVGNCAAAPPSTLSARRRPRRRRATTNRDAAPGRGITRGVVVASLPAVDDRGPRSFARDAGA